MKETKEMNETTTRTHAIMNARGGCSVRRLAAYLIAAAAMLSCIPVIPAADLGVDGLRCEYLDNPMGIDVTKPRLSWRMEDLKSEIRNPNATRALANSENAGEPSGARSMASRSRG
ncbi:MAG: hypothetical protein NTV49_10415 [Kiritimatiellaeota bacterium]|nr:hypothetical protein [Kiritimatiellota bacterium]